MRRALVNSRHAICFNEPKFMVGPQGFRDLLQKIVSPREFSTACLRIYAPRIGETMGLDLDDLASILSKAAENSTADRPFHQNFLLELHAGLHQKHRNVLLLEKEPHVLLMADVISRLSSETGFIHIFRDPRDVCCSVLKSTWGPNTSGEFLEWYKPLMLGLLKAQQQTPQSRYAILSLERLVSDTAECLEALGRFTGAAFDENALAKMSSAIDPEKAHIGRYENELGPTEAKRLILELKPIYDELRQREAVWTKTG